MPANRKYLTTSKWQRFAKISAAILGGYLVSATFHIALASWFNHVTVIITSTYSAFIVWATLMIFAFLAKNGWRIWGIYILVSLTLVGVNILGKMFNPVI